MERIHSSVLTDGFDLEPEPVYDPGGEGGFVLPPMMSDPRESPSPVVNQGQSIPTLLADAAGEMLQNFTETVQFGMSRQLPQWHNWAQDTLETLPPFNSERRPSSNIHIPSDVHITDVSADIILPPVSPPDFGEHGERLLTLTEKKLNYLCPGYVTDVDSECSICLSTMVEEEVRSLPCIHTFHVKCIDRWLLKKSARCPLCRRALNDYLLAEDSSADETSTDDDIPPLADGAAHPLIEGSSDDGMPPLADGAAHPLIEGSSTDNGMPPLAYGAALHALQADVLAAQQARGLPALIPLSNLNDDRIRDGDRTAVNAYVDSLPENSPTGDDTHSPLIQYPLSNVYYESDRILNESDRILNDFDTVLNESDILLNESPNYFGNLEYIP